MRSKRDQRGFRRWPEIKDSRGTTIEIHESSADPLGKWTWVTIKMHEPSYRESSASFHGTKSQFKRLLTALQDAVEKMEQTK